MSSSTGPEPGPPEPEPASSRKRVDPTKMVNQPALQSSNGRVWMIMGGLFAAASMIPFGLLVFAGSGRSRGTALTAAVIVLVLYAALLTARFAISRRRTRLRVMAVCMLGMAAVALVGIWLCALIENAPAGAS